MNKYLSILGYHGPTILLGLILYLLAFQQHITAPAAYIAVLAWQLTSHLINVIIKIILQAPRPDSDKDPDFTNLKPTLANFLTIHREYGMPSGHAQATVSELTFIALYFRKPLFTIFAFLQTGLTLYQRYATRRHSIKQLLAGSSVGLLVGLGFYKLFLVNYSCKLFHV
jgi:membrane-associated phospholipid phosphatase